MPRFAPCSRTSSSGIPALGSQIFSDGEIATFVNVYLGGEDVRTLDGLDTEVAPGQTVILLPAMAGGSTPPRSRPVVSSLLDLVGNTPLVELSQDLAQAVRADLRQARRPESDGLDQGSRRKVDDRGGRGVGRAEAGQAPPRADVRQHGALHSR